MKDFFFFVSLMFIVKLNGVSLGKTKKIITLYSKCNYKVLDESICKPNKIWPDKGNEFYNRLMKLQLQNNDKEVYSTHNEGESIIAE